ncbi:MAG: triose-phosphate isomerase [Candidatus Riflebacteria bacterium]|nr:triose-phosphate isomerase [Candidatus Riflebacteria bacterium]
MTRKPMIAANWKMHKTIKEAKAFMAEFLPKVAGMKHTDILICPPFPLIAAVNDSREGTDILLGAQNMYFEEKGAFTGEVAPAMLKELGCDCVILGHSERRWVFGETNELINKKVKSALEHDLIPVLCVGEKLEEREAEQTDQVLLHQLEKALEGVEESYIANIIIAYEPVWAIGTGKNATAEDAEKAISLIREYIHSKYGTDSSDKIRILYGGSVKPANIGEYMKLETVDGALVGGASLEPASFAALMEF